MFSYHKGDPGPVLHTMGQQLLYSYCVLFLEKFNTFIALYPTIFGYIAINVLLYTETNLALIASSFISDAISASVFISVPRC